MNSTFLMLVCAPCAAVLSVIWFFAALNEKGINPFYEIFGRYRRQTILGLLLIPIFVLKAISFGSNKAPTNDAPGDASASTNAPLTMMAWPGPQTPDPWLADRFTSNELASGSVLWRTGTNEVWNFDLMPGAHVVENWRLRGAADDWAVCVSTNLGPVVMTTDGRLVTTNGVFTAYGGRLAVVPEANWGLLGTNAPSRVWWADTPWESAVFTWQNVLADRDTNTPVSVQAEFMREGDFIFRYDLAATGTNLTSELYYRLRPEDMKSDDRDGDEVPTADEIKIYHTDPGLVDTDGDGLLDDDEISAGTDPAARSVPNAEIVARVTGSATNAAYAAAVRDDARGLVSLKLWDGFAADWPTDGTNLVYERTLSLGTQNGLHHYYLSSREMEAGGWDLRGLVLEWDDGCGLTGTVSASRVDDSYRLPLTNATVTIRLRATGPKVRCPKPMYLIGYTPLVSVSGGTSVCDETGRERAIVCEAGEYPTELEVVVDRSNRPCKAAPSEEEAALSGIDDVVSRSRGAMSYEGDGNGGLILVRRPGSCQLPEFTLGSPVTAARRPRLMAAHPGRAPGGGEGTWILCLDPYINYGGDHVFTKRKVWWSVDYYYLAEEYPLDGMCLWRNWEREVEGDYACQCRVVLEAGGGLDELPFVTKEYTVVDDVASGSISVFGETVWTGIAMHSWRDVGGHGGKSSGSERLSGYDECEECVRPCEDGNCDALSGAKLNSVAFRLSLGVPRMGQHSGFLFFESDGPLQIEPSVFALKARSDAAISCVTSGASTVWRCADARGRDVAVAPIADGVRLTVTTHATGAPDESWEIVNEGGDSNVVRMVQLSRLDNVMSDVTFVHNDGVWSKTDNVTGVTEVMEKVDLLNDPSRGKMFETRTKYDADGNQLDRTYVESSLVGLFSKAVLRETYWEQDTGSAVNWREASYWDDPANVGRHGQLRLLTGNCIGWEYHDYTPEGFETLRVEQRNGSPVPSSFPEVYAGDLYWTRGLDDAIVTVFDYTPFEGDDQRMDDNDRPRCETRYVVRNGNATLVGRTWTRYTHESCNGYAAVRAETWRAASPRAARTDAANAYSYVVTYSETAGGVPLVLRGEVVEEMDEDGVLTQHFIWESQQGIVNVAQKSFGGMDFPTYDETETDPVRGTVLRRATCLSSDGTVLEDERSSYDEKDRLRATAYSDGTSLTNAYSCCRLLWSADREGRRTLRSAVTGLDGLYYADEEVWLAGLTSNGEYRVVQHFFDGLGRETNTVTFAGGEPGAYTAPDAASVAGADQQSSVSTSYPFGGDDCSVTVDARGKVTVREGTEFADRLETLETVSWDEGASTQSVQTLTTAWRNGAQVTERSWDDSWTREIEWEDYDADGCAVRYEVTESSDCGAVTNRVTHSDFLGRTVLEETPLGTTATTYQGATGRADVTTVTAGGVTRVSTALYNALGEEVGSVQDGVTSRTDEDYESDSDGSWWKVTRSFVATEDETASATERREQLTGRTAGVVSRRIDVDADGVVEETVERTGAAEGERVTSVSNAVTGVRTQTRRYGVALETTTPDETRRFAVDAFGRKVAETRQVDVSDGIRVLPCKKTVYNAFGDIVTCRTYTNETEVVAETFAYDAYGRKVSSVDALGNETVTAYDAVGNVVERRGATWPVRYGYDTAGRRVSLSTTKDGRIWDVTRWTYDPATGKCTAKRYPDGSQIAYSLTPDGLPFVTTKASGAWVRNVYDEKRQLVGTATGDGAGDAAFAYDAFGKMTAASNGVAAYVYARHRGGIVTNEWADLDEDVQIVRTVDGFGRLSGRGVSDQNLQSIAYDGQGRVAAVSSGAAVATYAYGAGGVDAGYVIALNGGVTIERRIVRDAYRPEQIVAVSNFVNGAAVGSESYARDAKGRIVERKDGRRETRDTFDYDAVGQVVEMANYNLLSTNYQLRSYSYDQIGNIAGAAALAYTTDGEVTGVGGLTFGYDSASRLTTVATGDVTIAAYAYDAFDRRVRKTTPEATTTYLYDGWNLVREEIAGTNGTTDVIEYYWGKDISGSLDTAGGIGGLLYLKRNGAVYVPLYDASGNVTAYVDAAGNVVATFAYDAFGNTVAEDGTLAGAFHFKYSTKYHDAETGLVYYGYRYYAPPAARWLTRDPLEEQGGLNLHCFCENDGVNRYDALGLMVDPTSDHNAKAFWSSVALIWFRGLKHYDISADLLLKALYGGRSNYSFGEDSVLSKAIKKSSEYKKIIGDLVARRPDGYSFKDEHTSTRFRNGDLQTAVGKAEVEVGGDVCKSSSSARLDLAVEFSDDYNFEWWGWDEVKTSGVLLVIGNNWAHLDQQRGVIKPYHWTATFTEKRRWPW